MNYKPKYFTIDSWEYDVLYEAAQLISGVPGFTCEVGLREGGGTEAIVQGFFDNYDNHVHIAIDPYGDLIYAVDVWEVPLQRVGYTNEMKMRSIPKIHEWCSQHNVDFIFFNLEDTEFFKRYADGVPVYSDNKKSIINEYALVHIDGPHSVEPVTLEAQFFIPRISKGGILVFDDTEFYKHDTVHALVMANGFEVVRLGHKTVYRKL